MNLTKYCHDEPKGNSVPVFVDGIRTPFVKSFGVFEDLDALALFSYSVDSLLRRCPIEAEEVDEVISGVVIPQTKNPNVARDAILKLGLPLNIHGYSLNRACTSSLQAIADAAKTIKFGHPNIVLAGGVECLSNVPIVYSKKAQKFLLQLSKAKSSAEKLNLLKSFSAKAWLPQPPNLTEPLTGLTMGQSAEVMARINQISREEQDNFALASHKKAAAARESGKFQDELTPVWSGEKFEKFIEQDNLIRPDTDLESLSKLRPAFDRQYGSLTAGNSSALTDGAAVSMIADEARAKALGLKPKLYIKDFFFAGIDAFQQLLIGPAIAIPKLLKRNRLTIEDIDLFEIHEAFAAQVLSCLKSMSSKEFCEQYLGMSKAFGEIPENKINVNGGAIAIGHPFGATGSRLVTTIANEMIRSDKQLGVIAICAAGGMAGAMLVERYR